MSLRQPHLEELSMGGGTIPLAEPVTVTDEDRELYDLARSLSRRVCF